MRHQKLLAIVALLAALPAGFAFGQVVAPPPVAAQAAPAAPKPNEDDLLLLTTLAQLGTTANSECQNLQSVQRYNAQRAQIQLRLEAKYPGYTPDLGTGVLSPKKP